MQQFPELSELLSLNGPWVHFVVCPERDVDTFVASSAQQAPGAVIRIMRGKRCPTADRLFQECAAAFQFPYYFGNNWDALNECINDLEWLPGSGYVLCITRLDRLLTNHGEFSLFMQLLKRTASEWAQPVVASDYLRPPVAFRIVLHSEPEDETASRQRLLDAGIVLSNPAR